MKPIRFEIVIVLLLILAGIFTWCLYARPFSLEAMTDISCVSDDGKITVAWNGQPGYYEDTVRLICTDESGNRICDSTLWAYQRQFAITNGTHGECYTISICVGEQTIWCENRLYLEYDLLPDLPIVNIETVTGEDPTCDILVPEDEKLNGETIENNEYVGAQMAISKGGTLLYGGNMSIRIRGNTSAQSDKKPYMIKLNKAADLLLDSDNQHKSKNWILLKDATSLNTITGLCISSECGMEWEPEYCLVNVFLNGDWKGCYLLVETIEVADNKIDIGSDGFLIENDAYWWTGKETYFFSYSQIYNIAYTIKYPRQEKLTEEQVTLVKGYIDEFEKCVSEDNSLLTQYLELDSWVNWLLSHDVLSDADGAGSNMYLIIPYLTENTRSRIQMGPVWDFDQAFTVTEGWSAIHNSNIFYDAYLMTLPEFQQRYVQRWEEVRSFLYDEVTARLEQLADENGEAIQKSRILDAARWGEKAVDLTEEIQGLSEFLKARIRWIDKEVDTWR